MAKLKTLTYGRKVSDGDYGSFHLEVTIELEEGDRARDVLAQARKLVHTGLGIQSEPVATQKRT
jgi:hypothetical protein